MGASGSCGMLTIGSATINMVTYAAVSAMVGNFFTYNQANFPPNGNSPTCPNHYQIINAFRSSTATLVTPGGFENNDNCQKGPSGSPGNNPGPSTFNYNPYYTPNGISYTICDGTKFHLSYNIEVNAYFLDNGDPFTAVQVPVTYTPADSADTGSSACPSGYPQMLEPAACPSSSIIISSSSTLSTVMSSSTAGSSTISSSDTLSVFTSTTDSATTSVVPSTTATPTTSSVSGDPIIVVGSSTTTLVTPTTTATSAPFFANSTTTPGQTSDANPTTTTPIVLTTTPSTLRGTSTTPTAGSSGLTQDPLGFSTTSAPISTVTSTQTVQFGVTVSIIVAVIIVIPNPGGITSVPIVYTVGTQVATVTVGVTGDPNYRTISVVGTPPSGQIATVTQVVVVVPTVTPSVVGGTTNLVTGYVTVTGSSQPTNPAAGIVVASASITTTLSSMPTVGGVSTLPKSSDARQLSSALLMLCSSAALVLYALV